MTSSSTTNTATTFSSFKGLGILCFYGEETGLFQGHCIDKTSNKSPFSLAGKLLVDYIDPNHNDCMDPDDFYQVLIQAHSSPSSSSSQTTKKELVLRRSKNNDAAGLFTHEHEQENNDGFHFLFETHQLYSGGKAMAFKNKYFPNSRFTCDENELTVCMGEIELYPQPKVKEEGA